jgi:hypothetical protein
MEAAFVRVQRSKGSALVLHSAQYTDTPGLAALWSSEVDKTFLRLRVMAASEIVRVVLAVEDAELHGPEVCCEH